MNKLFKTLVLAFLLAIGVQASAQTYGNMFLSATFPQMGYSNFYGINDFALVSHDDKAKDGAAAIGFNIGLKLYFNVGVEGLNVMLSLDGFYNGLKYEAKTFFDERRNALELLGNNVSVALPKYINAPGMLGINYIYHINPNFGVYGEAGAGVNARFITEYSEKYKDLENVRHSGTVKYEPAFSFAFQAGFGIEVASNLVIGFSFYNLGGASVIAEKTGDIPDTPCPENTSLRPVLIMGRVGFCF